jgi:ribosomal protein L20
MTRRKTDPIIAGRIRHFLDMNWSYSRIIRQLLTQNIKVSKHLISDIKNPVKKSVK